MDKENIFNCSQLELAVRRIQSFSEGYRQNLALLGSDGDHTEYILRQCIISMQNRPSTQNLVYTYAHGSYVESREFFRSIALNLLHSYSGKDHSLDMLIAEMNDLLPKTTALIKENLKERKAIPLATVLELINVFIEETAKGCILIIEEFTELKRIWANFGQLFSQFLISQKKCMVIVTSSDIEGAQSLLLSELNLLFGKFEKINLNEATFLDNYLYLKSLTQKTPLSPMFLSFLSTLLGTNIPHCRIAARYLESYSREDEIVSAVHIFKKMIFDGESYFFQKFIGRMNLLKGKFKDFAIFIKLLLAISEGYMRKNELTSLGISNQNNISLKLQKLIDLGYLNSCGDVYQIQDGLFEFWLSHVFRFYFYPSVPKGTRCEKLFEKKLIESLEIFRENFYKNNINRVIELVNAFKDDSLKIGEQKLKLPRIEKVKIMSYPENKMHFLIGEGNEIVCAGIKEDDADDGDIINYLEKTLAFKGKNIKRIFIALHNFSPSARLIAKDNKIISWDTNDINRLFLLYRKPILINENTCTV